jgi:hypothetical protein
VIILMVLETIDAQVSRIAGTNMPRLSVVVMPVLLHGAVSGVGSTIFRNASMLVVLLGIAPHLPPHASELQLSAGDPGRI